MVAAIVTGLTEASFTPVLLQLFTGEFLQYAIVFFVLAIVAALLGARGVAGVSMQLAKWFVIIFLVLTIIALVL